MMLIDWKIVGQNSKLTKMTIFLFFFLQLSLDKMRNNNHAT